jgi:hypothetical protein
MAWKDTIVSRPAERLAAGKPVIFSLPLANLKKISRRL